MYRYLGIFGAPEILAGKDDWLYLYDGGHASRRTIAKERFKRVELASWVDSIAKWHAYLEARGIHVFFMVAPEKHIIYPENFP